MKLNSKSRTKKILAVTWLLPALLASPYAFSKSYPFVISSPMGSIARQICNDRFDEIDVVMYGERTKDRFRRGFFIFLFLAIYLVPMLVILATCVRIVLCLLQPIPVRRWPSARGKDSGRRHEENKRKVARMVIVVAVAFIVSWSPFYLSTLVSQIQSIATEGDHFLRERNFLFTMLMIHLCGFLNSCINPLIYTGMSNKFRRSFKMILSGCICCRLKQRFLRYRESLTRGISAAFTSSLRHSMTEVRDANDLALCAGESTMEGSPYSVRSILQSGQDSTSTTTTRGGHHQPSQLRHNTSISGHHHQSLQSCPNRLRQDLCQHSAHDARLPAPSSFLDLAKKHRSRTFRIWRPKEQPEVVIELTHLQPHNTDSDSRRGKGQEASMSEIEVHLDEEKKRFVEEVEEFEPVSTVFISPIPDIPCPARGLSADSCAATASLNRIYPVTRDDVYRLKLATESACLRHRDCKEVIDIKPDCSGNGDGHSHFTLTGVRKDIPDNKTDSPFTDNEPSSASRLQKQNRKKGNSTLSDENGDNVHADFSEKGHAFGYE